MCFCLWRERRRKREAGDLVYCDEMRIRTQMVWRQNVWAKLRKISTVSIDGFATATKKLIYWQRLKLEALLNTISL